MNKAPQSHHRVLVVDSHTEGEPTRVILEGGPKLTARDLPGCVEELRSQHDHFRSAVLQEPRGSDVLVGALLLPPSRPEATAAVIFFNDVGYLGMCGHGTIGVAATLAHLGRLTPGKHAIETPVGLVEMELLADGRVAVRNVPSYRYQAGVAVDVPGFGRVVGDIAWGGNWFFLVAEHGLSLELSQRAELLRVTTAIRETLASAGITGADGAVIDHVELFGPAHVAGNSARNFVLCPGAAYDRSPCGTGTSAKLACLFADSKLREGEEWRQEGILGTHFSGSVEEQGTCVLPTITGQAWITGEATLLFDATDPFVNGITFA